MAQKKRRRKHTTDVLVDRLDPKVTKVVQYPKPADEPRVKAELRKAGKGLEMEFSLDD